MYLLQVCHSSFMLIQVRSEVMSKKYYHSEFETSKGEQTRKLADKSFGSHVCLQCKKIKTPQHGYGD